MPFPVSIAGRIALTDNGGAIPDPWLGSIATAFRERGAIDLVQEEDLLTFWGPKAASLAAKEREKRGEASLPPTRPPTWTILGSVDRGEVAVDRSVTPPVLRYRMSVRRVAFGTLISTALIIIVLPLLGDRGIPLALGGILWVVAFGVSYTIAAIKIRRLLRQVIFAAR